MRARTAYQTDQRVRHISEIIDGIATVKSYAWEIPFFRLLSELRAKEVSCINKSFQVRAVNLGLYYCSPPVAAFATFSVFWATGGTLTLPIVFSTLSLLLNLRTSIGRQWTRSIETGSEAVASAYRVERFLSLPEEPKNTRTAWTGNGSTAPGSFEKGDSVLAANPAALKITTALADSENMNTHHRIDEAKAPDSLASNQHETASKVESLLVEKQPKQPENLRDRELLIEVPMSSYYYGLDPDFAILKDIHLQVHRGELLVIAGPVGAGKVRIIFYWTMIFLSLVAFTAT
jgi:ABC-type multidrug transport system fused ATPase/permease subunit